MGTKVGAPARGEVLAGRYRLDEPVDGEPGSARVLWRGTDTVLARSVAIQVQVPGGDAAEDMLAAGVAASRVEHPAVVAVYDAVDEGERAWVVYEWPEGRSLTEVLREELLEPGPAVAVTLGAAEGVAALHARGHVHGNLHPGSVLLSEDGGITLTSLRGVVGGRPDDDVRAIGGLLYSALTGHWPGAGSAGSVGLPDAVRADGRLCSPRQIRAGIPGYVDALAMDLLDPLVPPPSAEELAAELRRLHVAADPDPGPLAALALEPVERSSGWKRLAVPLIGLVVLVLAGWLVGTSALPGAGSGSYPRSEDPTRTEPTPAAVSPTPLPVRQATILDPGGDGTELGGAERTVDGDPASAWRTDTYTRANFGNIPGKAGMGVIVDLGSARSVREVTVRLSAPEAAVQLYTGDGGDQLSGYRPVSERRVGAPSRLDFELEQPATTRYVLVWITVLPRSGAGYSIGVQEIAVAG